MMKKAFILTLILLFVSNTSFAFRPVTKAEHEAYLRGLGLNEVQITKLEEIDRNYLNKRLEIQNKTREYRRSNPAITKDEYSLYSYNLKNEAEKNYKKELGKVMNFWQKKKYLEYKSRVY